MHHTKSIIYSVIKPDVRLLGCFKNFFWSGINSAINIFMEISLSLSLYSFLDWKYGSRIHLDLQCQNSTEPVLDLLVDANFI